MVTTLKCRYIPTIKCDMVGKYELDDPRRYEAMSDEQFQIFFGKPKPNYIGMAVYAKKQYGIDDFSMAKLKDAARKQLNVEDIPMEQREANFKAFEKRFHPVDPDGSNPIHREGVKKNGKAYKVLKKYSETDYGATMIKKVNQSPEKFTVYGGNYKANANDDFLMLPDNIPLKPTYESTDQEIDTLAVTHHEFEHTEFGTSPGEVGTLYEERFAVINSENPVRILNGYEPRYTYYNGEYTINILSGDSRKGSWTYDPDDPSELIKL